MQANTGVRPRLAALRERIAFRNHFADVLAWAFIGCLYVLLPLLPLLASVVYQRTKYVLQYRRTLNGMLIHLQALREGPVHHYFRDVAGKVVSIPPEIRGDCTQCGNCCLDKRCVFLEKVEDEKYLCGIYHAPLRRFSNCGSFPVSAHDIERYACPGYVVVHEAPIIWTRRATESK